MNKLMGKAVKGVCLAGGIYAMAQFFWKIGRDYGTGMGVALCCAIEKGKVDDIDTAMEYVKYIEENENNVFGALFMGGAMYLAKNLLKENN